VTIDRDWMESGDIVLYYFVLQYFTLNAWLFFDDRSCHIYSQSQGASTNVYEPFPVGEEVPDPVCDLLLCDFGEEVPDLFWDDIDGSPSSISSNTALPL